MAWPALDPGRLLERRGDVAPRRMTVHDRTRLIGRLRRLLWAFALRRRPRFVPPQAVQNAGPAPGMPHPRGCRRAPLTQGGLQVASGSRLSLRSAAFFGHLPEEGAHASYRRRRYKRGSRSGHATSPRLSPRPLDSRGLAGSQWVEALSTLRRLLWAFARRRRPRFVPPQAVQNAGPAPGMPHPRGCRRAPLTQGGLQVASGSRLSLCDRLPSTACGGRCPKGGWGYAIRHACSRVWR
ncbi:hypothetical protein XCM_4150 [Xanthomonas citri pv. mangiferaeindicae]|nr:hypothetical protein XCM_4150 [Xanthomonas citri pv. mangiferaeindicae]